jgi:hypothetical protein
VLRLYGARLAGGDQDDLVVEVCNQSHLPFAVALVVGPAPEVAVQRGVLLVDGALALVGARPPSRVALGRPLDELFARIAAGGAEEVGDRRVRDSAGRAGAALLWPLPHTATLRALVPLDRRPFAPDAGADSKAASAPTAEQVAGGWRRQLDAGVRAELADPTVDAAITAARAELVLAGRELVRDPIAALRAVRAATRWGHDDAARVILAGLTERVESDNGVAEWVALLSGLAEHQRIEADPSLAVAAVGTVAAGVARLDRALRRRRSLDADARAVCRQAMLDGARLLEAAGQPDAAAQVRADAERHHPGPGPRWSVADLAPPDEVAGEVAPVGSEDVIDDDETGDNWAEAEESRNPASPAVQLARAVAEAATGKPEAWDRVRQALASSSPTWTWTEASAGPLLLDAVRTALVIEVDGGNGLSLDLLPGWSPAWWGQPLAAYRLPTRAGALSFALRWHGDRPALLWEIEPSGAVASVEIRTPCLDATWRSNAWRGEVLLAPRPAPPGGISDEATSTSFS